MQKTHVPLYVFFLISNSNMNISRIQPIVHLGINNFLLGIGYTIQSQQREIELLQKQLG